MTKRPDDDAADQDDGLTTSERRRRRRRGGIRIPSDNVPRHSGSQPVIAPIPEDPALAVSIAYAFTDDGGGGGRAPTTLPIDDDLLDDATSIGEAPRPDGSVSMLIDDIIPDGRTRQMPAISLEALGLTALDPDAMATNAEIVVPLDGLVGDTAADSTHADPTRATGEVEAVDIVVDDGIADANDGVPSVPMPRAGTVALSEDDLEELLEATHHGVRPSATRAKPNTAPPSLPPVVERTRHTLPPLPSVVAASSSVVVAPTVPSSVATPPVAPTSVVAASTVAVSTPAQPIAERAIVTAAPVPVTPVPMTPSTTTLGIVGPADAADSSEILADEILEVEEQSRAAAAPDVSAVPTPIAASASGPVNAQNLIAPPPPPATTKPPPAPGKKPLVAPTAATSESKSKRRGKPWFEDLFDEDYLRTLPFLTPQATQAEAAMVLEALELTPGAAVLDVGCGYGRHAMELAARGMHVAGVDLSLPMLLRGADEAQRRGLDINFIHADMREIDFDAQFDGAYCLFSTFGFFDDETNKKAASLVAKALRPGAKFVLEILNRDYVIGDLPTRVWWEGDGCVVLEEVEFNYFSSRVQSKRSVVFDDGRQVEQEISVRVYSLHEVGKLLHAAGLRVLEVSGSMVTKGRFLGNRSREIIVIAERRTDTKLG